MARTKIRLSWISAIVILGLGAWGFSALLGSRPAVTPRAAQEKIWPVAVQTAEPGRHAPTLTLYGHVESPRLSRLSSAVSAQVLSVDVREGASVATDAVLVTLDDTEARLLLQQREAELAEVEALIESERLRQRNDLVALEHEKELLKLAQAALERALTLEQSRLGSQSIKDEARQSVLRQQLAINERSRDIDDHPTRLAQLQARQQRIEALRDQARLDLERTRLRAPFEGRVTRLAVSPGDRVRPGEILIELYDATSLDVRALIPGRHLATVEQALRAGDALRASAVLDGRTIALRLTRLAAQTAKGSGGVDAFFTPAAATDALVVGQFLSLLLELPLVDDAIAVPVEALYGPSRLYVLRDERLQAVSVERLGEMRRTDGSEQVLVRGTELRAGDQIVTTHLTNAVTGLRVRAESR